jgi:hypothetical protein
LFWTTNATAPRKALFYIYVVPFLAIFSFLSITRFFFSSEGSDDFQRVMPMIFVFDTLAVNGT